jgi:hypothetical protein
MITMPIHPQRREQNGRADPSHKAQRTRPNGHAHTNGHPQSSPVFPFNVAEARRFLLMLDGEADAFLFAAGDDDQERKKRLIAGAKAANKPNPILWRHRRDSLGCASSWLESQQESGWGVFVSVQAMKAARCQIAELAYIRAVYAEMDIGEALQAWPLEPSIIVETSPDRYHVYWLVLADAPISGEDFHGIMMRLVETYGSDPAAKDLARRLRLPGTWNLKPGRAPFLVNVVHETGARYRRQDLLEAFPPPPRPKPDTSKPRPKFNGHTSAGLERFVGRNQDGPLWSIRPDNYGDWLRVGMALHADTSGGSDALALWDQWSAGSDKWSLGVCADKWPSFGARSGVNGGTIFYMAAERGWTKPTRPGSGPPPGQRKSERPDHGPTDEATENSQEQPSEVGMPDWPEIGKGNSPRGRSQPNILVFLQWRGIKLAHNAFTMRELATVDGKEREVDDDLLRSLWLEADRLGLSAPEKFFVSVVLDLAHKHSFHPVRQYLEGVFWDGKPRLDRWLVTYAGAADTPLVRAFGSKHLLAAVLRVLQPGAKHDAMLVLEGPQGIGKSSLIRALAGDDWFSDALTVGEESRKVIELTSGVWLGEIAELKGLGNREAEQVKAMLSRQSDRARLAYGRMMTDRQRQFVLFGSVNDSQYLRDLTGNRRFWPVRCGKIDEAALRRDRDQIWAEAAHRQAQDERIELPPDLWAAAAIEQDQRVLTDPWQMKLEPLLEGKVGHVEIAQINQCLGLEAKHQNGQVGQRIAAIMARLGFARTRLRRNGARVYAYSNMKLSDGEAATWIVL